MIEPRALDKLIENGISIMSYKDKYGVDNASMIRNVRVMPDGRISFMHWKRSSLFRDLHLTNAFVLSVLKVGTDIKVYENLFVRFDTTCYRPGSEFYDFKNAERQSNGLYGITDCTNAIISCVVDQIIAAEEDNQVISRVTEGKLLYDEPSMTDGFFRQNLRKYFTTHQCFRCDMLYSFAADVCVFCGGDTYPVF